MARTKQYVVYTREFTKGNVNSKVGVFIDEAKNAMDKNGNINGGVIKFKNLAMTRKTPTKVLLDRGYDFNVRVLAKSNYCLLYTSPSPRAVEESRMPSSA